jgi:hypothetical protein
LLPRFVAFGPTAVIRGLSVGAERLVRKKATDEQRKERADDNWSAALSQSGSNAGGRTYRERCQDVFDKLKAQGEPPLRALQRIRFTIAKWCRNRRIASDPVRPAKYRSLSDREILRNLNIRDETVAWLMTPDGQPHRRRLEIAAHNYLKSSAGLVGPWLPKAKRDDWAYIPRPAAIVRHLKKVDKHKTEGEGLECLGAQCRSSASRQHVSPAENLNNCAGGNMARNKSFLKNGTRLTPAA